ncbi:UNVERIFIED_CONTAM: hypothetical protein FKN15_065993 [Acipenser sinensis]
MVSRKITDKDSYKVVVIINSSSSPPSFIQNELKPEELEQLKVRGEKSRRWHLSPQGGATGSSVSGWLERSCAMSQVDRQIDLVTHNIDLVLNRRNCMQAVNKVIEENIPEVGGAGAGAGARACDGAACSPGIAGLLWGVRLRWGGVVTPS